MLTRRLLAVGAALALMLVGAPVLADPPGGGANCPPGQTNCDVWGEDPGTPGNPGGGGNSGGGSGGSRKCFDGQTQVPCYDDVLGWWNSQDRCRYMLAEPQPSGVTPGKLLYVRSCSGPGGAISGTVELDAPPPGFEAPPSPEDVARRALASITMENPVISTAPRSGGSGLVGLPVWLWIEPGQPYWGTISRERQEQSVSVRIEAKAYKIEWDLGDGSPLITCSNPGTRYTPAQAANNPACGRATGYQKSSRSEPNGRFTVTATTYWQVRYWIGSDTASNSLEDQERESSETVQIDELQVVTE